jgi:hypothetical protein
MRGKERERERKLIYFTTMSFAKINSNEGS